MTRLRWEDLDDTVVEAIISQCGQIRDVIPLPASTAGGPLVTHLHTTDAGGVVVKAALKDTDAGAAVMREQWAITHRDDLPAPPLVWHGTIDATHVLISRYINDHARTPRLSAGSPNLDPILFTLETFSERFTAASVPDGAPLVEDDLMQVVEDARRILDTRVFPAAEADVWEAALARMDFAAVTGSTLVHGQFTPHHLLVDHTPRVVVLDWSKAAYGAAWAELVPFGVHLIYAGWPPKRVEELLATSIPCWRTAPHDAVTALIAAWTLHQMLTRQTPAGPIRPAGLKWVGHRLRST
ncbi:phosphotransferase [Nonomuraea sp. KM90]|uniref:phosphotransferase n=1 Tax=Nonomuraea sp. KM90 TaxID=3457428 RepID=UPI003FCE417B